MDVFNIEGWGVLNIKGVDYEVNLASKFRLTKLLKLRAVLVDRLCLGFRPLLASLKLSKQVEGGIFF